MAYFLILRNPDNPTPTDIRHHRDPKEAPMKKTKPFILRWVADEVVE